MKIRHSAIYHNLDKCLERIYFFETLSVKIMLPRRVVSGSRSNCLLDATAPPQDSVSTVTNANNLVHKLTPLSNDSDKWLFIYLKILNNLVMILEKVLRICKIIHAQLVYYVIIYGVK